MKRMILVVLAAVAMGSVALAQAPAGAGNCPGPGACPGGGPGYGPRHGRGGGPGARGWDPATVTTVSGTVAAVDRVKYGRGEGVHLQLTTSDGNLEVHLGPAWYLDQKLTVKQGDTLEVTGSKRTTPRGTFLVAQSVRSGDATVTLRDASGVPVWAGARGAQ